MKPETRQVSAAGRESLARSPGHPGKARVAFALVLLCIALAFILASRHRLRFDLSEDGVNRPDAGLATLVRSLQDPLRIVYMRSELLRRRSQDCDLIEGYLQSLQALSRGRLQLEILDPAGLPEARRSALQAATISIVEKEQARQATVFSGFQIEYLDRSFVVPFFLDPPRLGALLARSIPAILAGREPAVAILVGDRDKSLEDGYSLLVAELQKNFWKPIPIQPGDPLPEEATLLLVLGSDGAGKASIEPLATWLRAGHPALFCVRGVSVVADDRIHAALSQDRAVSGLLSGFGVDIGDSLVMDRSALTVPFQASESDAMQYFLYPPWIMARPENATISGGLAQASGGLDFFWPSPLSASGAEGTDFQPLIVTGKNAWLQKEPFVLDPGPVSTYEAMLEATKGRYTLAATVRARLPGMGRPSRFAVIGSPDFASDLVAMTGSDQNLRFFLSLMDSLMATDAADPIGTSVQPVYRDRHFTIGETDSGAMASVRANYILNLILLPLILLASALLVPFLRARRARRPKED